MKLTDGTAKTDRLVLCLVFYEFLIISRIVDVRGLLILTLRSTQDNLVLYRRFGLSLL